MYTPRADRAPKAKMLKSGDSVTCIGIQSRRYADTVTESIDDFIFPAPNFGTRFGISQNRFYDMLRYLRFCPESEYIDKEDKWSPVRRLIKSFNERRAATFYSGWSICVDESMSSWRGKDGNYCSDKSKRWLQERDDVFSGSISIQQ